MNQLIREEIARVDEQSGIGNSLLFMTPCAALHAIHCTAAHKPTTDPYAHVNLHIFMFDSQSNQSPGEIEKL